MLADFSLDRHHPVALSQQVADRVADAISSGQLDSGQRLPSERDLVRLFDVSKDTVRKALSILVDRGLVIKSPSRGSFVASSRLLADRRTRRQVHVFLEMDENSPWEGLIRGLSRELHHQGLDLLLKDAHGWDAQSLRGVLADSVDQRPAGIITYPWFPDDLSDFYRSLSGRGVPIVFVDAGIDIGLDAVVVDEAQGIGLGVRHLWALGHRKIAYIAGNSVPTCEHSRRRVEAFARICAELELQHIDEMICQSSPANSDNGHPASDYRQQIAEFLQGGHSPTGVVCFNDTVAMTVWSIAEQLGMSVPDDLSIVGFDNENAAENWPRLLTTIEPRMVEIGRTAARRLVRLADSDEPIEAQVVCVQPKLIVRQSSAPPLDTPGTPAPPHQRTE